MTYATGTLEANANPGPALYALLEPHLLTAGFTLIKTVTIGSRTHKVLRSLAANNTYGKTWFLDIHYPTTGVTGGMYMTPFEDFDSATDLAYRGPFSQNSTIIDGTTYSRYGSSGFALETNWTNTTSWIGFDNPLSTAATGWWMSATTDRVIFASTAAAAELHYVGFFEPSADHIAAAGSALHPLIVVHFASAGHVPLASSTTTNNSVNFTRVPPLSAVNWQNTAIIDIPYAQLGGIVGAGGHFAATNKTYMPRRPVTMGSSQLALGSPAAATGGLGPVGHLIDITNTWTDTTVVRGDTLTDVSSNTWIAVDDQNNVGLWFKAV